MTTITDIWQPGREAIDGSIVASLAMNGHAWTAAGAPLAVVDRDPLGETSLAVGAIDSGASRTEFGVLTYSYDDTVSHLVLGGPYEQRPALTLDLLGQLTAIGLVDSDAVLEIVGLVQVAREGPLESSAAGTHNPSDRERAPDGATRKRHARRSYRSAKRRKAFSKTPMTKIFNKPYVPVVVTEAKSGSALSSIRSKQLIRLAVSRKLTRQELGVLVLLEQGNTASEIAIGLDLEDAALRRMMRRINTKLGADSPKALADAISKR